MVRFQTGVLLDKLDKFYGILVLENLNINNIIIKIGRREVILIPGNAFEGVSVLDFFNIIKYLFSLGKGIDLIFVLTVSPGMSFTRKKLKTIDWEEFSLENLLSIIDGKDLSVYYSKKNNDSMEQFLGIEIRFNEEICLNAEKTVLDIMRRLGNNKNKINLK